MIVAERVATYSCARCGKKSPAERMVFLKHTRSRYCADIAACDRRFKRKARA